MGCVFSPGSHLPTAGPVGQGIGLLQEAGRRIPPGTLPQIAAGNLLTEEGQYEKAKTYFDAALRPNPSSRPALRGMARSYAERREELDIALNLAQELKKSSCPGILR